MVMPAFPASSSVDGRVGARRRAVALRHGVGRRDGAGRVGGDRGALPRSVRSRHRSQRWGDSHSYFLMPNGGFESGATSWGISGDATVVSGNESYYANGATDSKSLAFPAGASATSPTICVGRGESSFRLFVKNPGVDRGAVEGSGHRAGSADRSGRTDHAHGERQLVGGRLVADDEHAHAEPAGRRARERRTSRS